MLGHPLVQMMIVAAAGWVNRDQQSVIDYQSEEIRVLRALIGKRRLRFSDDQRREQRRGYELAPDHFFRAGESG